MNNSTVVEMKNVYYEISGKIVLENINLKVEKNDFLAIIGPNGGGKTTLLKLIVGLIKPCKGVVKVFGKPPELARKNIGYMPQITHYNYDFPITVFETVLMGRYPGPLKRYSEKDIKTVEKWLKKLGIWNLRDKNINDLSGGQIQRVFLARALVREPKLLLLDEPTASIDPGTRNSFYKLLNKINRKMTIILVSHDVGVVSKHVKKIACLNRRIFVHDDPKEVLKSIEELYKCPVNIVFHEVPHEISKKH